MLLLLSCFSHVRLFVTRWAVARQAPLSMGIPQQEYWSRLPCPPPGRLPDLGIKPTSPVSPALHAGEFFTCWAIGETQVCVCVCVGVYLCVCTINRNSFYLDFMDFLIYLLDFFDVLIGSQTCLNHTEHQSLFTIQISDILCGGKTGNITVRKNYPHIASMLSNCMHPAWHTQGREMV